MPTPLIDALTRKHGFAAVNEATLDAFLKAHAEPVLFFAGDAERLVESDDVAVILPELLKVFPQLAPALVEKPAERAASASLSVQRLPCAHFPSRRRLSRRDFTPAWLARLSLGDQGDPGARTIRAAALQVSGPLRTSGGARWRG